MKLGGVLLAALVCLGSGSNSYFLWEWDSDEKALRRKQISLNTSEPSPTKALDKDRVHHGGRAGQDTLVMKILTKARDGVEVAAEKSSYFVDLAANHYAQYSNTYRLERDHNWRGICIEPNSMYTAGLLSHRNCSLVRSVVTSYDGEVVKFEMTNGQGGIIGPGFDNHVEHSKHPLDVIGATLNTILSALDSPSIIDYLSLDVEGAEAFVIKHLNFTKYTFLIITVERPSSEFHSIMVANGYWWVNRLEMRGDTLYIHQSLNHFEDIMKKYRGAHPIHRWAPGAKEHPYLLHPPWPVIKRNVSNN